MIAKLLQNAIVDCATSILVYRSGWRILDEVKVEISNGPFAGLEK